jgi:AraC-like DNA-binding protein
MPRTLLVIGSPQLAPFLRTGDGYDVREVEGWREIAAAARREPPSTLVLAEPFTAAEQPDPGMRDFLLRMPSLPVVAAIDLGRAPVSAAREVLGWGISELLDLGLDRAPDSLICRLETAHARPFKRRVDAGVSRHAQARARTLIHAAAAVAVDGGLADDFAHVLGVHMKTMAEWCRRHGLPAPRRLLAWMRVLLALMLLEEADRTWRSVAGGCGYTNDANLRRTLTAMLGRVPSGQARQTWTFAHGIAAFNRELTECRELTRRGTDEVEP